MTKKFNEAYDEINDIFEPRFGDENLGDDDSYKRFADPSKRRKRTKAGYDNDGKKLDKEVTIKDVKLTNPKTKKSTIMKVKQQPNGNFVDVLNLYGQGWETLPEELTEVDKIRTLTLNANPLTSLENLPPKVDSLVVAGSEKTGAKLQSVAGSPNTEVGELTLTNTDITTLEGMPKVTEHFSFSLNKNYEDKNFTGLNVGKKLYSLADEPDKLFSTDKHGGATIELNPHVTAEDFQKVLQDKDVKYRTVKGDK